MHFSPPSLLSGQPFYWPDSVFSHCYLQPSASLPCHGGFSFLAVLPRFQRQNTVCVSSQRKSSQRLKPQTCFPWLVEHSSFVIVCNIAPLLLPVCEQPIQFVYLKIVIQVGREVAEEGTLNFFSPLFELSMEKKVMYERHCSYLACLFLIQGLFFNSRSEFYFQCIDWNQRESQKGMS